MRVSVVFSQLPDFNTYLIRQLNTHQSYSGIWGYVAPDGREYAILGCYSVTSFVDITDSSNIREVDTVSGVGSLWREIKTYSHYAYVVSEGTNSKLQIIDLQYLPDSVSLVNTWNFSGYTQTHSISQYDHYLYLSGSNAPNNGIQIVDILNPVLPVRRGSNNVRYVHECRVTDDTVWACNVLNQKVTILNAVDKDNPVEIRNFNTLQSAPHNCAITNDKKYLYVTHENNNPGKLEIWNIEDINNITYVRNWQPTGILTSVIHNIEIYDSIAIAAHYSAGVRFMNISDPSNPVEIAWYDTRPVDNSNVFNGCWGVYKFPSGKIIASDVTNGLFVIKTTFLTNTKIENNYAPHEFSVSQNYPNPFNPLTKINYLNPVDGNIKISIYDIHGRLVEILEDGFKYAGNYVNEFNSADLASGIYFCKLEFNSAGREYVKVLKMSLLK
ncbi:MAG TPA: choice-of-anchor B family protein [Ignavibacteria bacterium]|nr:choice-of-anchor B family protein [Ignavibacteria bacterium]